MFPIASRGKSFGVILWTIFLPNIWVFFWEICLSSFLFNILSHCLGILGAFFWQLIDFLYPIVHFTSQIRMSNSYLCPESSENIQILFQGAETYFSNQNDLRNPKMCSKQSVAVPPTTDFFKKLFFNKKKCRKNWTFG